MKRIIYLLLAIAVATFSSACSKDEIIKITGDYRYDGNLESILDNRDFYDFTITDKTMKVLNMAKEDTGTFNYTRKGNKIQINPAIGNTVSKATIVETSDGFGLKLDEKNTLYFSKRVF